MSTLQSCSRRVLACRSTSKRCLRSFATEAPTPSTLSTSIILNRSPILTPKPGPFEQSYYAYQYKLQRALSTPFPQHFYFKRGVNLQQRFHNEEKDRDAKSFGAGFGKGPRLRLPPLPFDKPMPRETEADRTNDVKSLDRKGDRNLYLVLKKQADSAWRLPQGRAAPGEALHVAARNQLLEQCGDGMDTWIVGRQPVGYIEEAEKIFLFKAHIFAGQVAKEATSVADFAWLTKEELSERLNESYWNGIKDLLADQ